MMKLFTTLLIRYLGVEGLLNYREADIEKGAIYFCFPTEEGIKAFLKDFEDDHPKYKEAIFISPCPTPDEPFELVRKSPARQYLISWKDCAYNFSSNFSPLVIATPSNFACLALKSLMSALFIFNNL
jgi:hypothetical protein